MTPRPGAALRGEPAGQLPEAPTHKGRQDVTGITGNLGKLRFPHAKEFVRELSAGALEKARLPYPRPKKFAEYGLARASGEVGGGGGFLGGETIFGTRFL